MTRTHAQILTAAGAILRAEAIARAAAGHPRRGVDSIIAAADVCDAIGIPALAAADAATETPTAEQEEA